MQKKQLVGKALAVAGFLAAPALAEHPENPATELEAPSVEVISTTPLPIIGTPIQEVPANVQAATGEQIQKQHSRDITEFLDDNLTSININSSQGNPFQPDVDFRGFNASPLLGAPQGLSVFQDGVRVNESFGDTVNWDLIPQSAISSINLIPGSNPLFGLNTLGGSLAIHTKSGFEYPGYSIESYGGSFGTGAVNFEAGGHGERVDYFLTGNYYNSDGFRDHSASASTVQQWFGKVGYQDSTTDFDLSYTGADNNLGGGQLLPISFFNINPALTYTFPDITENRLAFLNLKGSHFITSNNLIAANTYYRRFRNSNFASNTNDNFDPSLPEDVTNPSALNELTIIDQTSFGGSVQYSYLGNLFSHKNQLTTGASLDVGSTTLTQLEQAATIGADGNTNSILLSPFALENNVQGDNRYYGLYFTDNFSATDKVNVTASGRYNYALVTLGDLTGTTPALNSNNVFTRFNPAVGINYNLNKALTTYAAYSEGMRAPTPVELACSDPTAPCSLPNEFIADPPLKAVVSRTWEAGARGALGQNTSWSAAAFHTKLANDIAFISSTISTGFFQNVGDTRRQGIELGVSTKQGRLSFSANYSFIDATFETSFTENSPSNSTADPATGQIQVNPGNRIPGIPRQSFKARTEYAFTDKFFAGMSLLAFSSQFARGNENNLDSQGSVPGYTVLNLNARYEIIPGLQFFARINNVLNKNYANGGILGSNFFPGGPGAFDPANARSELFVGPGAPIAGFFGIRYSLGTTKRQKDLD